MKTTDDLKKNIFFLNRNFQYYKFYHETYVYLILKIYRQNDYSSIDLKRKVISLPFYYKYESDLLL